MALFNDEQAADAHWIKLLEQAVADRHRLFMSVVNWGEIYYAIMRGVSREMADQKARQIAAMPIEIVPADLPLTRQAAIVQAPSTKCLTRIALSPRSPR